MADLIERLLDPQAYTDTNALRQEAASKLIEMRTVLLYCADELPSCRKLLNQINSAIDLYQFEPLNTG